MENEKKNEDYKLLIIDDSSGLSYDREFISKILKISSDKEKFNSNRKKDVSWEDFYLNHIRPRSLSWEGTKDWINNIEYITIAENLRKIDRVTSVNFDEHIEKHITEQESGTTSGVDTTTSDAGKEGNYITSSPRAQSTAPVKIKTITLLLPKAYREEYSGDLMEYQAMLKEQGYGKVQCTFAQLYQLATIWMGIVKNKVSDIQFPFKKQTNNNNQ